ncbi:MAG: hypothetical protein HKP58_19450 [Desulfatitalea sp.]|nr:hypothetical protein [Desulfatitalea sp.]NNK02593.1 hypothetical protein [Desulfatitalea sp.]
MALLKLSRPRRLFLYLLIVAAAFPILLVLAGTDDDSSQSKHKIFIAFGFHVNLYHSFRNDTMDESGFGKDIRIIRHIIRTLDHFNAAGIPVKGVWDFDNLFSLQEILPRYAPDIIEDIRRRIDQWGDEVILMSYNNGLVSAMTHEELNDAVRWSITNPWHSGVEDLFGTYTPIVRPQEMMTTPGSFSVYKKHGIKAVSLYYSATPFDAFSVFCRPLTRAEAHNPILYRHTETKEEMVVIPTYHIGDLVEHVSLANWASQLHQLQETGRLNEDALIFINYDADSELWQGIDLPWALEWLPSTNGIGALVKEVKDLDYVHFTTLGTYLGNHPPVGTFSFSQDTADGSFDGYNSWAEKAETSSYWTVIARSRRVCNAAVRAKQILKEKLDAAQLDNLIHFAELTRLRALSTTHFGMATPYVARQREQAMARLMNDLDAYSDNIERLLADRLRQHIQHVSLTTKTVHNQSPLDTVLVLSGDSEKAKQSNRFLKVPRPAGFKEEMALFLVSDDGHRLTATHLADSVDKQGDPTMLLSIDRPEELTNGIYRIYQAEIPGHKGHQEISGGPGKMDDKELANQHLAIRFNEDRIDGIYLDGIRQTLRDSLIPYIRWEGKIYPAIPEVHIEKKATENSPTVLRMTGSIPGPAGQTQRNGWFDYRLTLVDDLPYLILQGSVQYPTTVTADLLNVGAAGLMRRTDLNWQEVAPVEIRFAPETTKSDPVQIMKKNYLGVATSYPLDYFRHNDRNLNLDDVNNHITASYVGVCVGNNAMAVAMDNSIQSNFAFAPMKLQYHNDNQTFAVRVNPFGAYHGQQYAHPTRGNGNGFEVTAITGKQYASSGPTYNGVCQSFRLMLAFFPGKQIPTSISRDLAAFANPPLVISLHNRPQQPKQFERLLPPSGLVAAYQDGSVQFSWDNNFDPQAHYRILCGVRPGDYQAVYPAVGNQLRVDRYAPNLPFIKGRRYYATIESISAENRISIKAPEIQFTIRQEEERGTKAPIGLELKVLWANLTTMFSH